MTTHTAHPHLLGTKMVPQCRCQQHKHLLCRKMSMSTAILKPSTATMIVLLSLPIILLSSLVDCKGRWKEGADSYFFSSSDGDIHDMPVIPSHQQQHFLSRYAGPHPHHSSSKSLNHSSTSSHHHSSVDEDVDDALLMSSFSD